MNEDPSARSWGDPKPEEPPNEPPTPIDAAELARLATMGYAYSQEQGDLATLPRSAIKYVVVIGWQYSEDPEERHSCWLFHRKEEADAKFAQIAAANDGALLFAFQFGLAFTDEPYPP